MPAERIALMVRPLPVLSTWPPISMLMLPGGGGSAP
jgi:hypothetical protein